MPLYAMSSSRHVVTLSLSALQSSAAAYHGATDAAAASANATVAAFAHRHAEQVAQLSAQVAALAETGAWQMKQHKHPLRAISVITIRLFQRKKTIDDMFVLINVEKELFSTSCVFSAHISCIIPTQSSPAARRTRVPSLITRRV